MFSNYKIVDKTLILYIDYYFEFSIDFNKENKYSNMKNEIKKIIKKLKFDGEKITLMIGGIALATILIVENPKVLNDLDLIYVKDNVIPSTSIVLKEDKNLPQEIEISKEEEKTNVEEKVIPKKEKKESNIVKKEEKQDDKIVEEVKEEPIKETRKELTVTIYRNNGSILNLDLEDYLIGVVGAEMPASFDIEALKVQAIISRTYALKSIEIGRKLTDTVATQVFLDNDELRLKWGNDFNKYYNKIKEAVSSTKDIAIYYDNKYIDALFFASSNGITEDSKYVWGNSIPYLKSVDSSWDKNTTSYLRTIEKDLDNVLSILGINSFTYNIISRDDSGRVAKILVDDKEYSGVEFRNLLGLRSADFDIEVNDNKITFTTRGYGHGVGLSQYGANELAKRGYNYKDIIKHYYTGVEVK